MKSRFAYHDLVRERDVGAGKELFDDVEEVGTGGDGDSGDGEGEATRDGSEKRLEMLWIIVRQEGGN